LDLENTVKIDTNPSCGVTTGEGTTAVNTLDTRVHQSSHNAATKEYAYAHDDHLLHHNIATNTSDDSIYI